MRRVRYAAGISAGALDLNKATSGTLLPVGDAKYRILSLEYTATWADIAAQIDGGAVFGVAHGDYTDTEIEECLEISASISQGDMISREKANRMVRILGTIQGDPNTAEGDSTFDSGQMNKERLNWEIPIGKTLKQFLYNSSGTIWTTGSLLFMMGTANVVFT